MSLRALPGNIDESLAPAGMSSRAVDLLLGVLDVEFDAAQAESAATPDRGLLVQTIRQLTVPALVRVLEHLDALAWRLAIVPDSDTLRTRPRVGWRDVPLAGPARGMIAAGPPAGSNTLIGVAAISDEWQLEPLPVLVHGGGGLPACWRELPVGTVIEDDPDHWETEAIGTAVIAGSGEEWDA